MDKIIFETERLVIIEYDFDKSEEIYELYQDEAIIKYTLNDSVGKTKEQLMKGIKMYQNAYVKYNNCQGKWLVVERTKNKVIGFLGLLFIDELQKTELSYGIIEKYRGNGFATEAVIGLKKYVFEKLKLNEICALIREENIKSHSVVKRVEMENQNTKVTVKGKMFHLYEEKNPFN